MSWRRGEGPAGLWEWESFSFWQLGLAKGEITTSLQLSYFKQQEKKIIHSDFLFSKGVFYLREILRGKESWV